jgi:hypothetical protein
MASMLWLLHAQGSGTAEKGVSKSMVLRENHHDLEYFLSQTEDFACRFYTN